VTRINTNVPSLIAQRVLTENNNTLNISLQRLSTGLHINRGKDDPAGLIASENLRSEITGLNAAITNSERADQVVNIAEGGLQEISSLLTELQALVTLTANTAGLSQEEKEANQLQVDSILQTIDRLASATSFQGLKLLNGGLDYQTENVSSVISSFQVRGSKLEAGQALDVDVLVTQSAQVGGFFLSFGAASLNLGGAGADDGRDSTFVLEIAGSIGSRELSFSSGTQLTDIASTISSFASVTGVEAVVSGTGLRIVSSEVGADEFVSVKIADDGAIGTASNIGLYDFVIDDASTALTTIASTFAAANNPVTDSGQDVEATINGIRATTRGTVAQINTDFLDVEVDLNYDTSGPAGPNAAKLGQVQAFTILGGGADFQLASQVDINGKVSLGVQNVAVRELGRQMLDVGGATSAFFLKDIGGGRDLNVVDGDATAAQKVIDRSIREISSLRGRLGAFQSNVIGTTIRSLGVAVENTTAAESVIRDTDFAAETARLTQAQILSSAASSTLALANAQPQGVLQLLG
jgi:flagellin